MKSYHEMIQFVVDQIDNSPSWYNVFPAATIICEIYDISIDTIYADVEYEQKVRQQAKRVAKR